MEKRVAGVLHDARRHGADILLDTGRALRLGGLVNGKNVSLRRAEGSLRADSFTRRSAL
jgi:hypothetical protein